LVQKAENIRIIVSIEPFEEKCDLPRSHAISHDQQNKEMSSQQIHNTYQSPGTGIPRKIK
jgi:hypothetical protein